jgi:cephalosporin hydroxylase/glycosyltransferase involved in cell wall biosynthesis
MNLSPALSVIVVGYNMARELPRTIHSLSPALQRNISEQDYEILVVDNGSKAPPTSEDVRSWASNARLLAVENPTRSPVPAINMGLNEARGDIAGVLIDGARMASPGLLAGALEASRLHPRTVVGTLAFHLGPDVQMRSVHAGYDQAVEDLLLEASRWEDDPYRLYDISVLAGSSARGWFATPSETNAIFLSREHWRELGGYDSRFVAPGGGLANLDIWERLCDDPTSRIVMLMGEATFHQVHGGIATNNKQSPWHEFHAEYVAIRGKNYEAPTLVPTLIGKPHPTCLRSLEESLAILRGKSLQRAADPVALPIVSPEGARDFGTALPGPLLDRMQDGVMRTLYRGVPFLKSPLDIGLYMQLFSRLRPRTVIEIGCRFGGSALWFADMMTNHGVSEPRVISVDTQPLAEYDDRRIQIVPGDAATLVVCLTQQLLEQCPRPWLVVEDSSHMFKHTEAVLEFFHSWLEPGDYIVIEDRVVTHLSGEQYGRYENGPNRAVSAFLAREGAHYRVDTDLCDFYGKNVTYNPNGWLRRQ